MSQFIIRRLLISIPTLLAISFVIFAILELSPTDPVGNLPLTIPRKPVSKSVKVWGPMTLLR